ncbi:exosortase-associated EpsI family protein [Aquisphaera insulae]|uniref:exosortase-associated EpsI family protein n=1 Tax=Aquisphaera insulae TaxID=2712864 RepID=UPI0013E9BEAE|nr:exosortase-associated EpsI family protein [Aquisphaera insulae]
MLAAIRITTALALILVAGVVHGRWTNRWKVSSALAVQAAKVDRVPLTLGEWTATSTTMDEQTRTMAGAEGHLTRVYRNPRLGQSISVLLICGLPGDIATHTPDACYPGAGYTLGPQANSTVAYGTPPATATFRTAIARRGGVQPSSLRIFWSWNDSRGWSAPENARWSFASAPVLHKLYVIRETSGIEVDPGEDPCQEFLRQFLQTLDATLFAHEGPSQASPAAVPSSASH